MNIPEPERMDKTRLESINIINALRRGTVPAGGLERIAVGLDVEEGVVRQMVHGWMAGCRGGMCHPRTALEGLDRQALGTAQVALRRRTRLHPAGCASSRTRRKGRSRRRDRPHRGRIDRARHGWRRRVPLLSGQGRVPAAGSLNQFGGPSTRSSTSKWLSPKRSSGVRSKA